MDLFCDAYFTMDLTLGAQLENLGVCSLLLLYFRNKRGKDFMHVRLYVHLQESFRCVLYVVVWLQEHTPTANVYIILLGSQLCEELFCMLRTIEHNKNFGVLRLLDRLSSVKTVAIVFRDHLIWKQAHARYTADRLKPLVFTQNL